MVWRSNLAILASTMLQACVLVPFPVVPEKDEFAVDRTVWIRQGVTTRTEVVDRMGEPTVARQGGSLVIYGQARTVAGWFFGSLWGSGGTMPIEKKSLLLIVYESSNLVSQIHVLRGKNDCTESGLCVEAEFELEETGGLMEHESDLVTAVVYYSSDKNRPENQFRQDANTCGVYLYSSGVDEFLTVKIPGIGTTSIVRRGYLFWATESRTIEIQASRRSDWSTLSFECPANQLRFVNVYADNGSYWSSPKLELDGEATGKANVVTRSPILH